MGQAKLSDELAQEAAEAFRQYGTKSDAARALDIPRETYVNRLKVAAQRGMLLGTAPAMPGFVISKVSEKENKDGEVTARFIQQKPDVGSEYEVPPGHIVKGVSALVDGSGREVIKWVKTTQDAENREAAFRAVLDALKDTLPRAEPIPSPTYVNADLLNQYTVTDLHFGMLSWREETGADYDLKIAEKLLLDWFSAAIEMSPPAQTAILAQLGDLLHHDAHQSVTPTHAHVLDADSRLQKIIRVVLRTIRRIVTMLLEKHERVHIIMADANHDPAGGAWLRETFAMFYENEPRVTVDTSPGTYNAFEWGHTSLFYHHGHKRKIAAIDGIFAGKFREIFGRTKFSYAHMGHLHSDEMISAPTTMKVERHETLAAPDAYAANGGWLSGRSAKVITYHKRRGEVSRVILGADMFETAGAE